MLRDRMAQAGYSADHIAHVFGDPPAPPPQEQGMFSVRWLRTLAQHYPSLLVSGVCHAALGEIDRLQNLCLNLGGELHAIKAADCTGCHRAPAKEGDTYDEECMGCRRFYADMYATKESEE